MSKPSLNVIKKSVQAFFRPLISLLGGAKEAPATDNVPEIVEEQECSRARRRHWNAGLKARLNESNCSCGLSRHDAKYAYRKRVQDCPAVKLAQDYSNPDEGYEDLTPIDLDCETSSILPNSGNTKRNRDVMYHHRCIEIIKKRSSAERLCKTGRVKDCIKKKKAMERLSTKRFRSRFSSVKNKDCVTKSNAQLSARIANKKNKPVTVVCAKETPDDSIKFPIHDLTKEDPRNESVRRIEEIRQPNMYAERANKIRGDMYRNSCKQKRKEMLIRLQEETETCERRTSELPPCQEEIDDDEEDLPTRKVDPKCAERHITIMKENRQCYSDGEPDTNSVPKYGFYTSASVKCRKLPPYKSFSECGKYKKKIRQLDECCYCADDTVVQYINRPHQDYRLKLGKK